MGLDPSEDVYCQVCFVVVPIQPVYHSKSMTVHNSVARQAEQPQRTSS